jgi:hypothetical protein
MTFFSVRWRITVAPLAGCFQVPFWWASWWGGPDGTGDALSAGIGVALEQHRPAFGLKYRLGVSLTFIKRELQVQEKRLFALAFLSWGLP